MIYSPFGIDVGKYVMHQLVETAGLLGVRYLVASASEFELYSSDSSLNTRSFLNDRQVQRQRKESSQKS